MNEIRWAWWALGLLVLYGVWRGLRVGLGALAERKAAAERRRLLSLQASVELIEQLELRGRPSHVSYTGNTIQIKPPRAAGLHHKRISR